MAIHHTIIKLAARQGVILTQNDDEIEAHHTESNTRVQVTAEDESEANDAAREALNTAVDMAAWKAESPHPGVKISCEDGTFYAHNSDGDEIGEFATWSELLDYLNDYEPEESEDAADEDDEEEATHSTVDEKYKLLYAEIGIDGQDNGDWLALQMLTLCNKNVDLVATVAWANGVQREPVPGNRGWEGRYRMTISNMLRKRVADAGVLIVPSSVNKDGVMGELVAPAEFVARWHTRTPAKKTSKA